MVNEQKLVEATGKQVKTSRNDSWMSRNGWKKFTNGYVAITLKQVAINKKQMNVRKWAYKNKKDYTESVC